MKNVFDDARRRNLAKWLAAAQRKRWEKYRTEKVMSSHKPTLLRCVERAVQNRILW